MAQASEVNVSASTYLASGERQLPVDSVPQVGPNHSNNRSMWPTITVAITLILASCGMLLWHVRSWRTADHGGLGQRERDFLQRQFRRRWQASAMLGAIGLLLLGELWIVDPVSSALYWTGVALAVLWTALLALIDWLASRHYYEPLVAASQAERAQIQAEIDRYRREHNSATNEE